MPPTPLSDDAQLLYADTKKPVFEVCSLIFSVSHMFILSDGKLTFIIEQWLALLRGIYEVTCSILYLKTEPSSYQHPFNQNKQVTDR